MEQFLTEQLWARLTTPLLYYSKESTTVTRRQPPILIFNWRIMTCSIISSSHQRLKGIPALSDTSLSYQISMSLSRKPTAVEEGIAWLGGLVIIHIRLFCYHKDHQSFLSLANFLLEPLFLWRYQGRLVSALKVIVLVVTSILLFPDDSLLPFRHCRDSSEPCFYSSISFTVLARRSLFEDLAYHYQLNYPDGPCEDFLAWRDEQKKEAGLYTAMTTMFRR